MTTAAWVVRLSNCKLGEAWIPVSNLKKHRYQRDLDDNHLQRIQDKLSNNVTERYNNPIEVIVYGVDRLDAKDVWDPPEGVQLYVIDGWHRVSALLQWLKTNKADELSSRWKANIYRMGWYSFFCSFFSR